MIDPCSITEWNIRKTLMAARTECERPKDKGVVVKNGVKKSNSERDVGPHFRMAQSVIEVQSMNERKSNCDWE